MGSYRSVVDLLTKRVRQGHYASGGIPGERDLAVEAGVSYMTARKAVRQLIADGLLVRHGNGRVGINRQPAGRRQLRVAFIAPTFASGDIERWRLALDRACRALGAIVRPVLYIHWEDPLVLECVHGFDGVFLVPINEPLPPRLLTHFTATGGRLVVLNEDWSAYGVPSLTMFPAALCAPLLEHLHALGHRRIDCLNVQPENSEIRARIALWRTWLAGHRCEGDLISAPVLPYERPLGAAYAAMERSLAGPRGPAPALLAVTLPAAIGALRALHERGHVVGRDVAVGVINGEDAAAYQVPSLTALEAPDAQPFFAAFLAWMAAGRAWDGPLLVGPQSIPLVIRESTAPATAPPTTPARRERGPRSRPASR